MKRKLFLILSLFLGLMAKAQNNISVASFRLLPNDMTANTQGTMRIDQNGHTSALIKVVTTQTGFTFDVGMMGIVDTKQEPGEIWVYVPFGVKHITIRHPQLGVLRDYYFPITIEEARTYEMVLASGTVSTIVESDVGGSYLMMTVEPKTAMVYIDEQLKPIENGEVMLLLPYGKHTYRVEAPSYMNEAGAVEIGKERVELNISLSSAKATLTVNCPDAEADIYLNEQKKGRGSWTGQIVDGMYVVEARKAGHRTEKQSLTLAKQEQKTITLNAPQPIYGKLNLTSTPGNCEVYLDGKMIGKSPDVFSNVLVGKHNVELRKEGYENATKQINIEEGKIAQESLTLTKLQQPAMPEASSASGALTFIVNGVTFKMLPVEGGTFTMGATAEQGSDADSDEKPTHSVTLSSYYMGETEVTQALWQAVMGSNPSKFKGNNLPVETVSWNDSQTFINRLNRILAGQLNGKRFALPTEAQWEYAARGGNQSHGYKYSGSNTLGNVAWYTSTTNDSGTKPVGTKTPNELGLYDMSGNVWEWCSDWYGSYGSGAQTNPTGSTSGSNRVFRGGSWRNYAWNCRVSYRTCDSPGSTYYYLGLRLAL